MCMHMMISTEPSWSSPSKSILGIRNGWHISHTSVGHGLCSIRPFCYNTAASNTAVCGTRHYSVARWVGCKYIILWVPCLTNVAQHNTVNHSIEFVNPTTGVHTQNVELYWNRQKTKLKRMKGVLSVIFTAIKMNSCGGKVGENIKGCIWQHMCTYCTAIPA